MVGSQVFGTVADVSQASQRVRASRLRATIGIAVLVAVLLSLVSSAWATDRIGAITSDNHLSAISAGDGTWTTMNTDATDLAMSGDRILRRDGAGETLETNSVSSNPGWNQLSGPGTSQMAVDQWPPRLGFVSAGLTDASDNGLFTLDGDTFSTSVVKQLGTEVGATKTSLSNNRIGVIQPNGFLFTKLGTGGGFNRQYVPLLATNSSARTFADVVLTGNRLVVRLDDGEVWGKNDSLDTTDAGWLKVTDSPMTKIAADGTRVAGTVASGDLWLQDGALGNVSNWTFEAHNVIDFALLGSRVGIVQTNGDLGIADGAPGAAFQTVLQGVQRVALANSAGTPRIGAVFADRRFYVLEGSGSSATSWTLMNSSTLAVAMTGNRIVRIGTNGSVTEKDGSLNAGWTPLSGAATTPSASRIAVDATMSRTVMIRDNSLYSFDNPSLAFLTQHGAAIKTAVGDGRIAAILGNGELWVKEGPPTAAWTLENPLTLNGDPNRKVVDVALTERRIITKLADGQLWGKDGSLLANYLKVTDTPVKLMAASGNRIAMTADTNALYVQEGPIGNVSNWTFEANNVASVALDGNRIGVVYTNGGVQTKQGALNAAWGSHDPHGTAVKIALGHTDTTGPTITPVTGGLTNASPAPLVASDINVTVNDGDSGAQGFTIAERRADGSFTPAIVARARAASSCPALWCAGTPYQASATIDPGALGWATGIHYIVVDATDFAGNHATQIRDVNYYKTSWDFGGANHVVDTNAERQLVWDALPDVSDVFPDDASQINDSPLWVGLTAAEQTGVLDYVISQVNLDSSQDVADPRFAGLHLPTFKWSKKLNKDQVEDLRYNLSQGSIAAGGCALLGNIIAALAAGVPAAALVAKVIAFMCGSVGLAAQGIINRLVHAMNTSTHPGAIITVGVKTQARIGIPPIRIVPIFDIDPWNN